MGNMNKPRWWVSRGLDKMEGRFGKSKPIQRFIKQRLASQKVIRVLELGFGDGKCLLDLREAFPDRRVELYGVIRKKSKVISRRKDFEVAAKMFGMAFPKQRLLPKPYFYDAGNGLKFESNYFDVIISQVAFHYVGDKAKLIEEFWRVLKPKGKAFVEIDSFQKNYPDFLQINKETPRFVIYRNDKLVKLSSYLKKFRDKGYNIKLKQKSSGAAGYLMIEKNTSKNLKLNLEYDNDSSLDLTRFNNEKKIRGVWWGNRSVFVVK
jgi:ubiquinone/menaquinone biosynthesis C-methylase UbiE